MYDTKIEKENTIKNVPARTFSIIGGGW